MNSGYKQADAQAQANQARLSEREGGVKSLSMLNKLLNTPGNELYVLRAWLSNEAARKSAS